MEKSDRLKILRLLNGFTQAELAKQAGLPHASLGSMEKGKYGPAGETGISIAKALGVPFEYLYCGTPAADSVQPMVWIPSPPPRTQHLLTLISDVRQLFPLFLAENLLNTLIPVELEDGSFVFLIGRNLAGGTNEDSSLSREYAKQQEGLCFSCLLLANSRLVDGFITAINSSGITVLKKQRLACSAETFKVNDIVEIISKETGSIADADALDVVFKEVKSSKNTKAKSSQRLTTDLYELFSGITNKYRLSVDESNEISKLFASKCSALGDSHDSKIDTESLKTELQSKLDELKCKKINYKQIGIIKGPEESGEEDYLLIKEWLREFWLSADDDQKNSLFTLIKQNIDYVSWFRKYKKEVADGKRTAVYEDYWEW